MKSITRNSEHQWIGIILIILCGIAALWAVVSLVNQTGWEWDVDSSHIDHIGSYFSGLVGIVSIYYLYRTLSSQSISFRMSSFESRFVKMIELQRDKTKQLSVPYTAKDKDGNGLRPVLKGQDAISYFLSLYSEALSLVSDQFTEVQIRNLYRVQSVYLADCRIWGGAKLKDRTLSNIAYLITFIGVTKAGVELLKNKYFTKYDEGSINTLLRVFQLKLAGANDNGGGHAMQEAQRVENEEKKFVGFQQEFGNYFRQLFQIVNHVNSQEWLKYGDKYGYVKMLRSQLSNQEEVLLFYNSISDVGMAWEYENKGRDEQDENLQLITKYNILKNIPHNTTVPKVEDYYPLISYEDSITEGETRKMLEKGYK